VLVERVGEAGLGFGEAPLPLPQALFAMMKVLVAPVELVQPAAHLLLLLGDAPLDVLDLLLAGAALLLELGPGAKGHLLGLELGTADLGLGLAGLGLGIARRLVDLRLGLVDDAPRAGLGVADRANGGDLLPEISDQEGENRHQGEEQQHQIHGSLLPGIPRRIVMFAGVHARQVAAKFAKV
jgi:hypothetical protein